MADYQSKLEQFSKIETQVVALSVDSEEDAQKTVQRNKLTFPLLFGLDALEMVATIGSYISQKKLYLHATGLYYGRIGRSNWRAIPVVPLAELRQMMLYP